MNMYVSMQMSLGVTASERVCVCVCAKVWYSWIKWQIIMQMSYEYSSIYADESGSDSDGAESTSSSYSSLSDFVMDMQNSDIAGDTPGKETN